MKLPSADFESGVSNSAQLSTADNSNEISGLKNLLHCDCSSVLVDCGRVV